ncbi:MAG: tRNA (adenosine(37)-N6)-threonylcarbamoyltransferase complex dimerization subunit type 1 TsaB [Dehalococcoidia bacterium]
MTEPLELSIDTASDMASIALSREGALVAELTWQAARDHTRQLLPAVDGLLTRQGASKDALTAVFVSMGPGSYAGVRSGVSAAKGLAFGLDVPIVGVGRLEVEAYAFAAAGGPVAAVQRAGRSELAWAAYAGDPDWREIVAPGLATADALIDALPDAALVTGEIDDALAERLVSNGHRVVRGAAAIRRAALLAELAWRRLQAGRADDPKTLVPLYLREPAIGPQK